MADMIFAKISVNKIDKEKLFKGKQNIYLDCTLMPNRNGPDDYGNDYFIVQSVSKEDRDKGIKGAIIGNAKIHVRQGQGGGGQQQRRQQTSKPAPAAEPADDAADSSVPF